MYDIQLNHACAPFTNPRSSFSTLVSSVRVSELFTSRHRFAWYVLCVPPFLSYNFHSCYLYSLISYIYIPCFSRMVNFNTYHLTKYLYSTHQHKSNVYFSVFYNRHFICISIRYGTTYFFTNFKT